MSNKWKDITSGPMIAGRNSYFGVHEGYEYKVMRRKAITRRLGNVPLSANSDEWKRLVSYIMNHSGDIKAGTNDFGELLPMWEFVNRNCNEI